MGQSSSQVVRDPHPRTPSSQAPAPATLCQPRKSPTTDDMAASQQLIEEGARAEHAAGDSGGKAHPVGGKMTRSRKANILKQAQSTRFNSTPEPTPSKHLFPGSFKSFSLDYIQAVADTEDVTPPSTDSDEALQTALVSPPTPVAITPPRPEAEVLNDSDSLLHNVEVPDSQIAPVPTPSDALMSPPMTSSMAIPASNAEELTREKGKKMLRAEVDPSDIAIEHDSSNNQGHVVDGTIETSSSSPSQSRRKLRRSYATPARGATRPGQSSISPLEQRTTSMQPCNGVPVVAEVIAETTTLSSKMEEAVEDDDIAVGDRITSGCLQRVNKKLRRKKSKFVSSEQNSATEHSSPAATQSSILETTDKTEDVNVTSRIVDQRPVGPNEMMHNTGSDANERLDVSASKASQQSTKPRDNRKPKAPRTENSRRRYSRTSSVDTSITAADRALNMVRELHHPPDLRSSGDFTEDEDELIRRAIRDYQQRNDMDTAELVAIIKWTDHSLNNSSRIKRCDWSLEDVQAAEDSKEFWEELSQINLRRKTSRIKTHVRAQYNTFKSGSWSEDDDAQLKALVGEYGHQWKLIAEIMEDRSHNDVFNRWNDYLKHGDSRNTGLWSRNEEELLLRAITTVVQNDEDERAAAGMPPLTVYTNKDIKWKQVCIEIGDIRSRVQCTVKWTSMKERNPSIDILPVYKQRTTPPSVQTVEPTPTKRGRPRKSGFNSLTKADRDATKSTRKRRQSESKSSDIMSVKTPKKRHQSSKSENVAAYFMPKKSHEDEISATPTATLTPPRKWNLPQPSTPGVAQMRWGDKFDLLEAVASTTFENEEDIDWHAIRAEMKRQPWSLRTLQTALKELLKLVEDKGNVADTANDVLGHISQIYSASVLNEHYDPYEMELDESAELAEGGEKDAKANKAITKRKREQNACNGSPEPRSATAKRKKTKRALTTPIVFKSTEFIMGSDDESGEEERKKVL